jgi:hypothetical protein
METVLILLKIDLGITHNLRDAYFIKLVEGSIKEINKRGIKLDMNNSADQMLVSDYAAWTYRKRQEDAPLASNIQHRLKNRIIEERIAKQNAIPEI